MFILDVIPAIRLPKTDIQLLSYFSKEPLPAGVLVRIALGSRKINAVVVNMHDLENQKMNIKGSRFQMKNISGVISREPVLNEKQLQLLKYLADYYIAFPTLFVAAMIPNYLINKKTSATLAPVQPETKQSVVAKPLLIKKADRLKDYGRIIDSTLASGKQVLLLAPELAQVKYHEKYFAGQNPVILTSELTPKKNFEAWNLARTGEARFIIGTRVAVFTNFHSLGAIIIDEEQSAEYKSRDMLPYYNAKTIAFKTAELYGARVIMGSTAPSLETYARAKDNSYELMGNEAPLSVFIIDMRNEFLDKNYSLFSYQLKNEIEHVLADRSQKAILFIARRGSQSFYFCADCKHIEKCPRCDASMVYHAMQKNILLCHHCGFRKEPLLLCSKCQSHNIKTFGAGTQKAAEELKKFWGVEALILDSDTAPVFKERQKIIEQFRSGASQILIGTQALLGEPDMPIADLLGIISLDNFLYIPDYKISERIFQIIRGLGAYAKKGAPFLWQTHTPENETLQNIALQNYEKFYAREIAERKALRYPPFSRIIKIILKDASLAKIEARSKKIAHYLDTALRETQAEYELLGPVPAYAPKVKNLYIFNIAVKILSADQKKLAKIFAPVQNEVTIDVDPENII